MTMTKAAIDVRVSGLEERVRRLAAGPRASKGPAFEMHHFTMSMAFGKYDTWRHQGLSLEERLALARDDAKRDALDENARIWAGIAAREIEVRILERSKKVGPEAADALRRNARDHFRNGGNLAPLPARIKMDEAKTLASALKRCPRRDSLPIEKQREMIEEDYRQRVAEAEKTPAETANGCVAVDVKGWRMAWANSIRRQALQDLDGKATGAPA